MRPLLTKKFAWTLAVILIAIAVCAVGVRSGLGYLADFILDDAISKHDVRRTNYALSLGANPCLENEYHVSMLSEAACGGQIEVVKILLSHGADPDIRNYMGTSSITAVKDKRIVALLQQAMRERPLAR